MICCVLDQLPHGHVLPLLSVLAAQSHLFITVFLKPFLVISGEKEFIDEISVDKDFEKNEFLPVEVIFANGRTMVIQFRLVHILDVTFLAIISACI